MYGGPSVTPQNDKGHQKSLERKYMLTISSHKMNNQFSTTDVLTKSLVYYKFVLLYSFLEDELMCSVFNVIFAVCSCDLTGALLDSPCDRVSGQCTCKEGIEGRKCDTCKQFYVNFGPSGCTSEYTTLKQPISRVDSKKIVIPIEQTPC